jgi:hypothetical protein
MQGVNIRKLIDKTLRKLIKLDFSSYSLEDERLAPDGGYFIMMKKAFKFSQSLW